jgi:hypothetical protein
MSGEPLITSGPRGAGGPPDLLPEDPHRSGTCHLTSTTVLTSRKTSPFEPEARSS